MRYVAKPTDHTALCAPCVASLKGWLVRLLAWFYAALDGVAAAARRYPPARVLITAAKASIARDLRWSVRQLGNVLILHGAARMSFARPRIQQRRTASAARAGIRYAKPSSAQRRLRRVLSGMNAGSLRLRAKRLAAALDTLEAFIVRMTKRMRLMWRDVPPPALILTAAREPCASRAEPRALVLLSHKIAGGFGPRRDLIR